MHRIVVVGGGAGGLELVTRLANHWGSKKRRPRAEITLVDINPTHIWKPLLHEVAAGSIDINIEQLEYAAQAKWHGFYFQQGALKDLDCAQHYITIAPVIDDNGIECLPERILKYDTLILAIGSITHFYNVPGAETYSFALDTAAQADQFRRRLMSVYLQTQKAPSSTPLNITIIGAGATGVELAAELRHTAKTLGSYKLHPLDPQHDIQITIAEASPRILSTLPENIANTTATLLQKLDIKVKVNAQVTQIKEHSVHLKNGTIIPSDLIIWAAGIKAPPVLTTLKGLEVNKQGQVIVHPTLQSISDPDIFAFGDCARTPWIGHSQEIQVPPRAQAAHQQASFLFKQMKQRLKGRSIQKPFRYRDFGSLIILGDSGAVGNLRDGITRHGITVRGWFARWIYFSLYRLHIAALHGWGRMILDTLGKWLNRSTRPRVKLH